jgi:hypothetical protein
MGVTWVKSVNITWLVGLRCVLRSQKEVLVSHLLFADDTLIFYDAIPNNFNILVLECGNIL